MLGWKVLTVKVAKQHLSMKSWQVIGMRVLLAPFNFGSFSFQNQNMVTEIYGL